MILSRCCENEVIVESANEGDSWYVCKKCNIPCDTRFSLDVLCRTLEE